MAAGEAVEPIYPRSLGMMTGAPPNLSEHFSSGTGHYCLACELNRMTPDEIADAIAQLQEELRARAKS